jgi:hypothetical protein
MAKPDPNVRRVIALYEDSPLEGSAQRRVQHNMVQATAGNVKPRKDFFRHLEALLKSPRKFPKDPEENTNCIGPARDFRRECSSSLLDRAP